MKSVVDAEHRDAWNVEADGRRQYGVERVQFQDANSVLSFRSYVFVIQRSHRGPGRQHTHTHTHASNEMVY